ncbi:MAG: thermonuclease family protein [Leadbetterella sp.]
MTILYSFLYLVFILFSQTLQSSVVGVQDGDTITLRMVGTDIATKNRKNKNLRVRLMHIDCPEKGEPYYQAAKSFTSKMCVGGSVTIVHDGKYDKYGRLLGEVILPNGKNLNKELVKNGLAKHFKKYSSDYKYRELEIQARMGKLGIWSVE